jgi:hypothetical protein
MLRGLVEREPGGNGTPVTGAGGSAPARTVIGGGARHPHAGAPSPVTPPAIPQTKGGTGEPPVGGGAPGHEGAPPAETGKKRRGLGELVKTAVYGG